MQNASLAVKLAQIFIESQTKSSLPDQSLPESFRQGLVSTKWPGRCQTVKDPRRADFTWYLDGAHTLESLECCASWFVTPGVGIPAQSMKESE